ncbi:MAG: ABC transporter ATP-binding protein [Atopobiaceae bacterium]|jgi:putative ABC transport system ATP-binding protein|nr:ABC transporter ATP-binding protein [Atopobiaceae bacterium]MCH4181517.1 ABC transporter ATP-binding protein [Atopobiaceae bacterium]MCH4214078.1 ABC transporter ATP-binding protein [Atopobiaceae bacterium]MCH4229541.1 ABC transporter ATP-binding protein [Atopobiaceae bacterium]MCH4276430.1 ABC transporter ATP-binding protein [Atopobiaceae bacterium]
MSKVLQVSNVEKLYGGGRGSTTQALAGVSFDVEKGDYVAIMGPSGSGKTTLLNCIATIDRPTSGTILIDGADVCRLRSRELAAFRRDQLGFIFQDSNLLDTLTCRENVALPLTIAGAHARSIDPAVEAIAGQLGVADVLEKYPYQVSGGQKQRVAASRAMVSNPTLVLADEPTGALDSKNAKLLLECFDDLNEKLGATILMVTHDSFAASYCRRVLFIRDGKLFTELTRGDMPRRQFFDRIMQVVAMIGGEQEDVL